jgi:protein required for attachment to host cells
MNDISIPGNALVLVGDGRKALFLRNRGTPVNPDFVVEHRLEQENPATREQGTDRPGRKHGSDGVSRSAVDDTDWHHQAERRFAGEIAERLYALEQAHQFDDLVVVAPPKLLGDLRAALHPEVTQRILAEIPKDLTAHSLPELRDMLSLDTGTRQ